MALFLLLFGVACAHTAVSNSFCNNNGLITANLKCECDAAWMGDRCTELAFLPANGYPSSSTSPSPLTSTPGPGAIYPSMHNVSSWGGTLTYGTDKLWHLLVSEMADHCGLQTWQRNSFIRHATSSTVDGIYTPREIVMSEFAHNAACMDARAGGGPACVLLHIGSGTHSEAAHPIQTNCTDGYTPRTKSETGSFFESESSFAASSKTFLEPSIVTADHPTTDRNAAPPPPPVAYIAPVMWEFGNGKTWENATLTCLPDAAGITKCPFDNPGGWVDADGTSWINFVVRGKHTVSGRGGYGFGIAKAPHWQGPYSVLSRDGANTSSGFWDAPLLSSTGTAQQNCEDGQIYRDSRGDFHMLFHYFGLSNDHGDHGGHAFASANGTDWQFSEGHAWNLTVTFRGSPALASAQYGYRQRPHVVLDNGDITHVLTGVVFDYTRPFPSSCHVSTGTHGPCDRAWTLLQPTWTSKSKCSIESNVRITGEDLCVVEDATPRSCCKACATTLDCTGWTLSPPRNTTQSSTCTLKNTATNFTRQHALGHTSAMIISTEH
eukprot:m.140917 g.140917  ORF g.140917 m.140917 type:complete len:549 (-) comp30149_c0_seq1:183-1829(-)